MNIILRKLLSYLPTEIRAKIKWQMSAWFSDKQLPAAVTPPPTPLLIKNEPTKEAIDLSMIVDLDPGPLGFPAYEWMNKGKQTGTDIWGEIEQNQQFELPEIKLDGRHGTALVSVCTMNRLYQARTMISSIRKQHSPDEIAIYLLIVDWDGKETLDLTNVTCLSGSSMMIGQFGYMALKYSAGELCCSCKPYIVRYVMATTHYQKILYLDIDICVFARLDEMLTWLDEYRLVFIPHTFTPPPDLSRVHVQPRLTEIMFAGSYNAGMFALVVVPENISFISQWAKLVTTPGAFDGPIENSNGYQEQQIFNWLASLVDDVNVFKNTAYNVAYWNLHDRSVRYTGWDEAGRQPSWLVDGKPLVAFHFSGFSLNESHRLSIHDFRYTLYFLPSITKLIEFYLTKLIENGARLSQEQAYKFDRFPSGLSITSAMRQIFKKHETFLWRNLDPWSEVGEHYYAQSLFLPMPGTASLLPVCLHTIYMRRRDLQIAFPNAHVEPKPMIEWFPIFGLDEEPQLYQCYNLYRPVIPRMEGVNSLHHIRLENPDAFDGLKYPMSKDRIALIHKMQEMNLKDVANRIKSTEFEYFFLSPIYLLWKFIGQQAHLQHAFPDFLFDDAPALGNWLREHCSEHFFDQDLTNVFLQKAQGHSLARIFSFMNEHPELAKIFPLGLVGENKNAFIQTLLKHFDSQFDLDDIVMYSWTMEIKPWAGLPLTFELLANASRQPSPLLKEGQDALLGSLVTQPEFQSALAVYNHKLNNKQKSNRRKLKEGINFFGYFKSPIGLGSLSHGLALAFQSRHIQVQKNILNNASMNQDLRPEDFIQTYDDSLDTNLFLSFPHLVYRLLEVYPEHIIKKRKNIVYLAWEQRDGYPSWQQDYAEFDQIWALSDFAAGSFRRYMKREDVVTIPGVIDFDSFPAAASKQEMGLDPEQFIFLYIFDASSSMERKNPEAAIRAFSRAFTKNEKVHLLIKVTNAHRLDCRHKLGRLSNLATKSGMDIRFISSNLSRPQLLKTISAVDCYVSLHRAEGFGYTCAEAMTYAKPVIATNYSGTTEFMDATSAFLVDYKECEIAEADGPFQRGSIWAEPSIEHAAVQMREVYLNQLAAKKIGAAGEIRVRHFLSAERVGKIAAAALRGKSIRHQRSKTTS